MTKKDTVGYGHPPKNHQFQPGHSGNPSGRPKGARHLKTELIEELAELVTVADGTTTVEVSKARAVVKALVRMAIAGDARAISTVMGSCARALGGEDAVDDEPEAPEDREIMRVVSASPKRRAASADSSSDGGDV
jgi:Family of unknown function (DUF5681)